MYSCIVFEDSSKSKFGGGQRVTFELMRTLNNQGVSLYLIDFTDKSAFYNTAKGFSVSSLVLRKFNSSKKTNSNSFSFSFLEVLGNLILFPLNIFILLIYFQKKNKKHIFICTTKKTMLLGAIIKLFYPNIKLVFHVHNVLRELFFWSRFVKYIVSRSDENWFVSDTVRMSYAKNAKGKLLYNPVNTDFILKSSKTLDSQINVGVVSNLLGYKGIHYFLRSYNHLPKEFSERIQYHIFGDGPLRNELVNIAKFNKNIIFHGFVSNNNEIYSNIDILICPSIDEEAFSLVLFEATRYSIPIIATNLLVHKEFFSDDSILFVQPKSEIEICNAIVKLITDDTLRNALAANAKYQVKNNFKESFQTRLISFYKSLYENPSIS